MARLVLGTFGDGGKFVMTNRVFPSEPYNTLTFETWRGSFSVRLFVDRSSIEAFGDGGKFVMTNRVFPSEPYNTLTFETWRGSFSVKTMKVHRIR